MAMENRNEHKTWFDVTGLKHPNWMEVPDRGCPPDPLPWGLSEGCFRVSEQEGKLDHSLDTDLASPWKRFIWGISDMWFPCAIYPDISGESILTRKAASKLSTPHYLLRTWLTWIPSLGSMQAWWWLYRQAFLNLISFKKQICTRHNVTVTIFIPNVTFLKVYFKLYSTF